MENTHWHKQAADKPLFEDLLWSRPETKQTAGKLLIIGGNIHGFAAASQAYSEAQNTGIGTARIVLPDSLQKTVSRLLPGAVFAPSTPSGSFAQTALATYLEQAAWADGVLIVGDLARNSETAIVLEKFLSKYNGQVTLTKDAVDYFAGSVHGSAGRPHTTLVLTMAQLQHLAKKANFDKAFTFDMTLIQLVDRLHEFTRQFKLAIVIKHLDTIFVSVAGLVSTTKTELASEDSWRVPIATRAAVWWLQNPNKSFEALTTSVFENLSS